MIPAPFESPSTIDCPAFLLCPPFSMNGGEPNNVFMKQMPKEKRRIDHNKALKQFIDMYSFVSNMALVYLLPNSKPLPDETFAADLGIKLPHLKEDLVVINHTFMQSRAGEAKVGEDFFSLMGYEVMQAPKFWQGQSELKYLRSNVYFGGCGIRSSIKVLQWFEEKFNMVVIPMHQNDPKYFHLDASFFVLNSEKVVTCPKLFDPRIIRRVEKYAEIIAIEQELIDCDITGSVRCRKLILNGSPISDLKITDTDFGIERKKIDTLGKIAADNGLELHICNLSEFQKRGGSLACNFFDLNYWSYRKENG
jgi:N-dimethylarginine dimethylaminohydrolase